MILRWVKMPTKWIINAESPPLKLFKWYRGEEKGSDYIAALILYICLVQQIGTTTNNKVKLSYSSLESLSSLSRSKISAGLKILKKKQMLNVDNSGKTNEYSLPNLEKSGWGKLPFKYFFDKTKNLISPFQHFYLRKNVEMDALKLYIFLISMVDSKKNQAHPGYEKIQEYTGIKRNDIRAAISLLVTMNMIHVQKFGPVLEKRNNFYRIIGVSDTHEGNSSYDKLFLINEVPEKRPFSSFLRPDFSQK